jgi:glycerol uptake facilitator-like aquaporin
MKAISKASLWAKLLYEFIGTAFLVFAFNASGRGIAYFLMWIIAYKVSGAHFNPATSLAVFIVERQPFKDFLTLFAYMVAQFVGAFAGFGVAYLLVKDNRRTSLLVPKGGQYFNPTTQDVYWGRPILLETTLTAVLTMAYLILHYDGGLSTKVDRVIKGLVMLFITQVCLVLSQDSGGCFNPAVGLA